MPGTAVSKNTGATASCRPWVPVDRTVAKFFRAPLPKAIRPLFSHAEASGWHNRSVRNGPLENLLEISERAVKAQNRPLTEISGVNGLPIEDL